jgi:hypothetical protein
VSRAKYLRRVFASYVFTSNNQLTFWHETPAREATATADALGPYWMTFADKANYPGPFDDEGVPMLDYHGDVGRQYNPIAIAQYALGHYNALMRTGAPTHRDRFETCARWLLANLLPNDQGVPVWAHHFDFEYFRTLAAPWHSGLAQGVGLSVLVRAHALFGDDRYLVAAHAAFESLRTPIEEGGVLYTDPSGDIWIEEYIVSPPTHILNGFLWALWGVNDYRVATGRPEAAQFFDRCIRTVKRNLPRYDNGFWSLYELTPQPIQSPCSPFYHRLHLIQLEVMHALTNDPLFLEYRDRWEAYAARRLNRSVAWVYKAGFKMLYW